MKNLKIMLYRWSAIICLLFMSANALAEDLVAITSADQPVRIIRGVNVLKGAVGVVLQKNDIVEAGASAVQIEAGKDLILAMAPGTKIYLENSLLDERNSPEMVLLSGWIKILHKRPATRAFIATPFMKISLENGSSVARAVTDKTEIFAESGVQTIAEIHDAKASEDIKIALEQYAFRLDGQPLKILPRPPKEFISAMPMTFRDPLAKAPDRLKGAKIQALQEREVSYSDIQPWLTSNIAARKIFVKRFRPRLKDTEFRKLLDAELGQTADWKPILHPPPPPKPKYQNNAR